MISFARRTRTARRGLRWRRCRQVRSHPRGSPHGRPDSKPRSFPTTRAGLWWGTFLSVVAQFMLSPARNSLVKFDPASWCAFIAVTAAPALPLAGQSAPLIPQRPSPENSIAFVYRAVDFRYAGSDSAAASIDFNDHALGVRLTTAAWRGLTTLSFE